MNKKIAIIVSAVAVVFFIALILILSLAKNIKNAADIITIREDSNLDIIVNLGTFSHDNYDEQKLLDVSMQIAEKLGMLDEYTDEDNYIQYVPKNDLHLIIYELTGLTIEAPIEIEDFYYLYDSENEYYYYRPATPSYFKVETINSIKEKNSTYKISCSLKKEVDFEITTLADVQLSLSYEPNNTLVKYKVKSIEMNSGDVQ